MRKPASVHIDIAEFAMTVMEIPEEKRSEWLLSFVRCLSLNKRELNEYGATLLDEALEYSKDISEKRREAANARWGKEKDAKGCKPMQKHTGALGCSAKDAVQTEQTEQTVLKEKDTKKKVEPKKSFGIEGTVKLTQEEYDRLVKDYGEKAVEDKIFALEGWLNKGNKSKSDNLTIRNWLRREGNVDKPEELPILREVVNE